MVAVNVIDPAGPGLVGIGAETGLSSGALVFDTGENTQASFITPLGEDGTISVNTWAATDLTVDVIGYFTAPTRTYRYSYDTTGLRASKSLDDNGVAGAGWSKEFTWDTSGGLPLLLAEHRGSQASYLVYGPQGTPIYQVTGTGDLMYFHQDHLGSIRLVTNANGTTKGTLTYNAYGKIKTNTIGWLQEQPLLGYNSQYHDPETGYIYLRARHYDPATGQFTSLDPLVAVTDQPYGYVSGDPANHADPTGLFTLPGWVPAIGGRCVDIADSGCRSKKDEIAETLSGPGEKSLCVAGQAYLVFGSKLDICLDWNSSQGLSSMRPSISPGGGIGSPSLGLGVSASSHDGACTNSDLGGVGSYFGGSAGFVGGQYGENTAPMSKRVRTATVSVGKSWIPMPEIHAGFDYTWTMNR